MSTLDSTQQQVVNFTVRPSASGQWRVCESGFEKAIAEFADGDSAEQYALRLAESKANWKVDVYDAGGTLVGTYNSEDDAMPKPAVE
ncbi:MAG: hypothetical protein JWN94_743 [Betaproteobacteria bacterium]|nr:hypothetical protein [Betaproteobacteria bacterium]